MVMDFNEWMRIKNGLKKAEDEAKRREQKILEQQALHEMSNSLVKNWENTIEVWPATITHLQTLYYLTGSKVKKTRG